MSKNILLGITGSVAASKSEILYHNLSLENNVKLIATEAGQKYLSEDFLHNNQVILGWGDNQGSPHIELARWADIFIVYPATANFISKMTMGIADDLLLSTILMHNKPIYIAPAMHEEMYLNRYIQKNLEVLAGEHIICGPRYGKLDIGDIGFGRLIEPEEMTQHIIGKREKIVVTSGGTYEKIDSVRTLSNSSTGKQGRALGIELLSRGYEVTYIHAQNIAGIPHSNNRTFTNSDSLYKILKEELSDTSYLYMAAAVSDYIPDYIDNKMDRSDGTVSLSLNPNRDIVMSVIKEFDDLTTIAFSAQTNDELNYQKLRKKNVDYLVINNITKNKVGSDFNQVSIINNNELIYTTEILNKNVIAGLIIDNTIG
ncbi:bifunctional phosphopantothenoylcysteine decarboxylase/phosphopantothenate--cysteine ligase CoaBC [Acidimicrobiia bacterium]|nr:bifunctional phosphopantothenoylcysteine decarboxylase/phosphopantothenate--cysteine ligase CoaBC [Acidimicrobiia bacterium]